MVDLLAFPQKKGVDAAIPVDHARGGDVLDSETKGSLFVRATLVAMTGAGKAQRLASTALADRVTLLQSFDQFTFLNRLQAFFDRTS